MNIIYSTNKHIKNKKKSFIISYNNISQVIVTLVLKKCFLQTKKKGKK